MEPGNGHHDEERWVSWGSGRPRNYFLYQHIPAHVKATYTDKKLDPFDYMTTHSISLSHTRTSSGMGLGLSAAPAGQQTNVQPSSF